MSNDKNKIVPLKISSVIIAYLSVIALVVIDQVTKYLIVSKLPLYGQKVVIDNFFSFYYCQNTGSAFSMFADKSWGIYFLMTVSVVMSLLICYAIYRSLKIRSFWLRFSLILFLSGAVGNLIDRFRLKYVVDFLRFDFGSYTFPIFNFADICAVVATALLLILVIFDNKTIDIFLSTKDRKDNKNDSKN